MQITFFIQDITTKGGTERTTCCLANEFSKHGHTVNIVSVFHAENNVQYPLSQDVRTVFFTKDNYSLNLGFLRRLKSAFMQRRKAKCCKEFIEADIIIGQRIFASMLLWISGYAKKSIACEHFKYGMYNFPIRTVRNNIYKRFRKVVVLTEKDYIKYKKRITNVTVIPNMISVTPLPNVGFYSKRIITVGRLNYQKGYDLLLQALPKVFKNFHDWKIDIFGEGDDLNKLVHLRNKLGLEKNVFFKGFVENIEKEYSQSSFYVMSSRFEGFPMVLLEAAACGLPIVSFDCPEGPAVLLKDGGGILVKPNNIEDLSEKILLLIKNEELRIQLQEQTHEIITPYLPNNIYQKWMILFENEKLL